MLNSLLSNPQLEILERALQAASLRHKVISNNIANVNTPGFKASEVQFEQVLATALEQHQLPLRRTNDKHLYVTREDGFAPTVSTLSGTSLRADGNNVDIDAEMANMAKNNIYYDALAQQIGRYFSNLKSVINEGRR